MKERPILFKGEMVRAILSGQKTQTRRILKPQIEPFGRDGQGFSWTKKKSSSSYGDWCTTGDLSDPRDLKLFMSKACPYGKVGDRLWVRETFQTWPDGYAYRADFSPATGVGDAHKPWRPSIFMPRVASRITLEITGVRVERLNEITRGDAMAEGCPFPNMAQGDDPRKWYADLWDSINGKGSWDLNPWAWVVEFKRLEANQ